jgi:hypothetical protein
MPVELHVRQAYHHVRSGDGLQQCVLGASTHYDMHWDDGYSGSAST